MLKIKMHFLLGILCIAYTWQTHAMNNNKVVIESADGATFNFNQHVIELSETVKHLIEDSGIEQPIPLPNVNKKVLEKIQEILNKLTNNGFFDLRKEKKAGTGSVKIIEESIQNLNLIDLYDLYLAVNYMDITLILPTILRATAKKIASLNTLFQEKGNPFIRISVAKENGVFNVFEETVKKLNLQEIQVLGWILEGKILNAQDKKIYEEIKNKYNIDLGIEEEEQIQEISHEPEWQEYTQEYEEGEELTNLIKAAYEGDLNNIKKYLPLVQDPNEYKSALDNLDYEFNALSAITYAKHNKLITFLLNSNEVSNIGNPAIKINQAININAANNSEETFIKYTPLFYAVIINNTKGVELLLRHGANINAIDGEGNTILHIAAEKGYIEIVKIIKQKQPSLLHKKNNNGQTPLSIAEIQFPNDDELLSALGKK